jgi:hypothetical protein
MSAVKRFEQTNLNRKLKKLEDLIDELKDFLNIDDLDFNRVLFVDNNSEELNTTNAFYYDGSRVGIYKIPSSDFVFDVCGNARIKGEVLIDGSLNVIGTLTSLNTQEVDVSSNYININEGFTGPPPITLTSGIRVHRGDQPDYLFQFSEEHKVFEVGVSGGTIDPVAERELEFDDRAIAVWDASGGSIYQGKFVSNPEFILDASGRLGLGLGVNDICHNSILTISGNELLKGDLYLDCNRVIDISNIQFCDGTFIGKKDTFDISSSNNLNISSSQTITIDPSNELLITGNVTISGEFNVLDNSIFQDVSLANLDISQNLNVVGDTVMDDVSLANLDISQNLNVVGDAVLNDVSLANLDISQNLVVKGETILNDVSLANLDISKNLNVVGETLMSDVSLANLDISQNLNVVGDTLLNDVSLVNLDISQNLNVVGDTMLNDVSLVNLDISKNLNVVGDTLLNDVSLANLDISQNLNVVGETLIQFGYLSKS